MRFSAFGFLLLSAFCQAFQDSDSGKRFNQAVYPAGDEVVEMVPGFIDPEQRAATTDDSLMQESTPLPMQLAPEIEDETDIELLPIQLAPDTDDDNLTENKPLPMQLAPDTDDDNLTENKPLPIQLAPDTDDDNLTENKSPPMKFFPENEDGEVSTPIEKAFVEGFVEMPDDKEVQGDASSTSIHMAIDGEETDNASEQAKWTQMTVDGEVGTRHLRGNGKYYISPVVVED